ncbi:MAG: hypothetical protein AVDCRST_MAG33-3444 [uncultured Thermomicrobiales bacterium]|uniref:Uncharacterized protein n=1 Tax=uncultured Thermomicrobiales bacterium TaxID=1645740 RepID=A0A6J4VLA6_9BACT|nr:MAG: hypothetical protein AVDCRST_MAG33-3444 [uncultured Thermomicrobiales bacterium]
MGYSLIQTAKQADHGEQLRDIAAAQRTGRQVRLDPAPVVWFDLSVDVGGECLELRTRGSGGGRSALINHAYASTSWSFPADPCRSRPGASASPGPDGQGQAA